jgi:GTP-binding protein
VLVHVVDGTSADPVGDLQAVNQELELFSPWLAKKPQVVVLNKVDVGEVRGKQSQLLSELARAAGHKRVLPISAATREQVPMLLGRLQGLVADLRKRGDVASPVEAATDLDDDADAERRCTVTEVEPGVWWVTGARIEKAAAMTNWDYYEAQARFQRVMQALGVSEQLKARGASNGDLIMVGDVDFRYFEETAMAARARLAGFVDSGHDDEVDGDISDEEAGRRRRQRELDEELLTMLEEEGEVTRF